jgi:hypothetical protein
MFSIIVGISAISLRLSPRTRVPSLFAFFFVPHDADRGVEMRDIELDGAHGGFSRVSLFFFFEASQSD